MTLHLAREIYDALKRHALDEAPRECCGLMGVRPTDPSLVRSIDPAINHHEDPFRHFRIMPADLAEIQAGYAAAGLVCGGVYHSHPCGRAYPSLRDIAGARFDVPQVIVGMGEGLVTMAWSIKQAGAVRQIPLEVY